MTIICALHTPGDGTWIGADSRVCGGNSIYPMAMRKIVRIGNRAILVSGTGMMVTLLERHKDLIFDSPLPDGVAAALVKLQKDSDFTVYDDGPGPKSWQQSFIYATPEGVWDIDGAGSWLAVEHNTLWARGGGSDYALGCDYALSAGLLQPFPPTMRIKMALAAATKFDAHCGEPFYIEKLE